MNRLWVGTGRRKSAELGKRRQQSAVVDWKSAEVGRSRHSSIAVGVACMQCRRIIGDRHTYWNIKGCGDAARVFAGKFLFFRRKGCGDFCSKCGTKVPPRVLPRFSTLRKSKWEEIYGK